MLFCHLLIFQNQLFRKILSRILSEYQTVWIQIKPEFLLGLIWFQAVCKFYQQTTLVGKELKILESIKFSKGPSKLGGGFQPLICSIRQFQILPPFQKLTDKEISCHIFFRKFGKMSQNVSSAAVVIGAFRVKVSNVPFQTHHYFVPEIIVYNLIVIFIISFYTIHKRS